jgi:hypothetical protein
MIGLFGMFDSRQVCFLAAAVCCLLLLWSPGPVSAYGGCGEYTECVNDCPDEQQIDEVCIDHMGGGCLVDEADCGWAPLKCGLTRDQIQCVYQDLGGGVN